MGYRNQRVDLRNVSLAACRMAMAAVERMAVASVHSSSAEARRSLRFLKEASKLQRDRKGVRRGASRWISQTIQSSGVLAVNRTRLQLQLPTGQIASLRLDRRKLVLESGKKQILIAEDLRQVRFTAHRQTSPPQKLTGVSITLQKRNPKSGSMVEYAAIHPPNRHPVADSDLHRAKHRFEASAGERWRD
ncbi:MAG: hypothetical protein ACR2NZ_23680 [Rubripirellula sp.]